MTEVSNTFVVRRLSVLRLLREYCDKTIEASDTSAVSRLSVDVCCVCTVTERPKPASHSVCDQIIPYVYCDKTAEVSDTSVFRRLSVRRLLRVYYDKTTEVGFALSLRSK